MSAPPPAPIPCIGSVLWDVIGRPTAPFAPGSDLPGRVRRRPGGVALNVAATLARLGAGPLLLSAVGRDGEGDALIAACDRLGIGTGHVLRLPGRSTDRYVAIETAAGLVAAVADLRTLEAAGARILRPLTEGPLGSAADPFAGIVVLDGNLAPALLAGIAADPAFAAADLRIAAAAPAKAARLRPLLGHPRATLYLNREEAGALAGQRFAGSADAARALLARGAGRVVITDGAGPVTAADAGGGLIVRAPPKIRVARVTGAGDVLMAAHVAAEAAGADPEAALARALRAAAAHVAGDPAP